MNRSSLFGSQAGGGSTQRGAAPGLLGSQAANNTASTNSATSSSSQPGSLFQANSSSSAPSVGGSTEGNTGGNTGDYRQYKEHVKFLSVYNYKGGVGKTTNTYVLSWAMALKGYKVLMVDCDPQANLTGAVLGPRANCYRHSLESYIEANHIEPYYEALEQYVASSYQQVPVTQPVLVATFPQSNGTLHLSVGSEKMSDFEEKLAVMQERTRLEHFCNNYGILYHVILKAASRLEIDVVVFDLSPSLGPLNRNVLAFSDY
jgi:hypothetical protein